MLLSMTGFGDARLQAERLSVSVEVRTVNNRYLKISTKCADAYAAFEGEVEKQVRETIARGTVSVNIRVDRKASSDDYRINTAALEAYWNQLLTVSQSLKISLPADSTRLLHLPGVVSDEAFRSSNPDEDWQTIRLVLAGALQKLQTFRVDEGKSMERELVANVGIVAERLQAVVALAPQVVSEYRAKVLERVRQLLKESEASVTENDLIREISIFADKADINEEITRLRCHLEQFQAFINEKASAGRKLDFLTQEMFREVNTIGSKANNVPIAHCVVEMKGAVEKIREILQNVE